MMPVIRTLYHRIRRKSPDLPELDPTECFPKLTTAEIKSLEGQRITLHFLQHPHEGILYPVPFDAQYNFVFREDPQSTVINAMLNLYPSDIYDRARESLIGPPAHLHRNIDGSFLFSGNKGFSWHRPGDYNYATLDKALRSVGL